MTLGFWAIEKHSFSDIHKMRAFLALQLQVHFHSEMNYRIGNTLPNTPDESKRRFEL